MLALFVENGPFQINENLSLSINPYSWNRNATIVYVDQPVGVGFSYTNSVKNYPRDETLVSKSMYKFIQGLYKVLPQYNKLPFYIFAESYGGHYAPALGVRILDNNLNLKGTNQYINLKGVGIGDGWVTPKIQYASYAPYAYKEGLLDKNGYFLTSNIIKKCLSLIDQGHDFKAFTLCQFTQFFPALEGQIKNKTGMVNIYDIRDRCPGGLIDPLNHKFRYSCYNFSTVKTFLNQNKVKKSLGINPQRNFKMMNPIYELIMTQDFETDYRFDIVKILEYKVPVMTYNGNKDLICNSLGEWNLYHDMKWFGQEAFNNATLHKFKVENQVAGFYKMANGLIYVEVKNSGHMVPMDQPATALKLLNSFLFETKL